MKRTTINLLGFDDYTFVDLFSMVYIIFHKERLDLCWKSKDLLKKMMENCLQHHEPFCRVIPLLVDTSGHLLLPLEMISRSNKNPLWSSKEVSYGCSLSQIRITKVSSILCIPRVCVYKPLYRKLTHYGDHK